MLLGKIMMSLTCSLPFTDYGRPKSLGRRVYCGKKEYLKTEARSKGGSSRWMLCLNRRLKFRTGVLTSESHLEASSWAEALIMLLSNYVHDISLLPLSVVLFVLHGWCSCLCHS